MNHAEQHGRRLAVPVPGHDHPSTLGYLLCISYSPVSYSAADLVLRFMSQYTVTWFGVSLFDLRMA